MTDNRSSSSIEIRLEDGDQAIQLTTLKGSVETAIQDKNANTTEERSDDESRPASINEGPSIQTPALSSRVPSLHGSESILNAYAEPTSSGTPSFVTQLPPVDKGRQAWTFLAVATLLECLIWGMGNSYGAFQDYHLYNKQSPLYGSSSAATAAAGTLITAGQYFAPFLFLGILNAFPHRIKLFQAITLSASAIGLVGASFHPNVASVTLLQGFLSGWSGGAFYTPAMLWLPQWFDQKRGFATGMIFVGSGIGGVVWPFALNYLLEGVGFEWTLRALAILQLILGATIAFFLRPRLPVQRPTTQNDPSSTAGSRHDASRRRRNILRSVLPSHNKILHSPLGIASLAAQFMQNAALMSVSYYIAPYASSLGLRGTIPTALLATFNAAAAISYCIIGILCDTLPHIVLVLLLSATGSLLVGLLLGFAKTLGPLIAFAILFGLFNGGFSTTMSPMAREMAKAGETEHSAVFLELMSWRGLGGVAGPLISSVLYKSHISAAQSQNDSGQIWGDNAAYGSHGLGPVILFSTALSAVVAFTALGMIPLRKAVLKPRQPMPSS
ncbi:MFS general substrate transporter [Meira miltonrushii]|uniref:MFS general substrate transporter n=1 Tax=Meira miltonrushii TaxID=1280837 RepID=A0A316V2D8_9BASI|nr:MFS general substrate transporter [Meira miltonrushii]PWN31716.1 MFS general substrate transporter [Meira miltonrushii]